MGTKFILEFKDILCQTPKVETLIIFSAKYLFVIVVLASVGSALYLRKDKKENLLRASVIALPLALALGKILSRLIINPRPFVVENVQPLIAHAADNGFPSDHVLLTATVAVLVFTQNRRLGTILFALALSVGAARVAAQVHHVSDILGSALVAIAATYIATLIVKHLQSKNTLTNKTDHN